MKETIWYIVAFIIAVVTWPFVLLAVTVAGVPYWILEDSDRQAGREK